MKNPNFPNEIGDWGGDVVPPPHKPGPADATDAEKYNLHRTWDTSVIRTRWLSVGGGGGGG